MQKILEVKMKVFYTHLVSSPSLEAQVLTSLTDLEPLPLFYQAYSPRHTSAGNSNDAQTGSCESVSRWLPEHTTQQDA